MDIDEGGFTPSTLSLAEIAKESLSLRAWRYLASLREIIFLFRAL
jgi:hypothetical protein